MSTDEHAIHIEIRHQGRRYGAETLPSGSTSLSRDGVWVCNGHWNGRVLDCGDNELHADLDESNTILAALAASLANAAGPDFRLDPRGRS